MIQYILHESINCIIPIATPPSLRPLTTMLLVILFSISMVFTGFTKLIHTIPGVHGGIFSGVDRNWHFRRKNWAECGVETVGKARELGGATCEENVLIRLS